MGAAITRFLDFTDAGASFVFGERFKEFYFAFKVLPTIIFFSSFITVLYYFGILQKLVSVFAKIMMKTMGTSGAESLSASANIFVGQTEAPLLIKPYVATMTKSELMAVMTGGFATIAGGVMAAYVGMGVSAKHLLGRERHVGSGRPGDGEADVSRDRKERDGRQGGDRDRSPVGKFDRRGGHRERPTGSSSR